MKETTISRLQKLSSHMKKGCDQCPSLNKHDDSGGRCCDNIFCAVSKLSYEALGQSYSEVAMEDRIDPTIPYLSKSKGCVIAPEHRPHCTMFACPSVLAHDRSFRREYDRIHDKLRSSDEIQMIGHLMEPAMRQLANGVTNMSAEVRAHPEVAAMVSSQMKFAKRG